MITKEALSLFRNENAFLQNIDTQYSDEFAKSGAKIGNNLNIRLPVDYTVRHGPTAVPQNTIENLTSLKLSNQDGVDFSFSSADYALSLDEFSKRYIRPAVNVLAGDVAAGIMQMIEGGTGQGGANHFVHNVDSNGNTITPTVGTILQAGAILDNNSAPRGRGKRIAMLNPITQSRVVTGMAGYFNPQQTVAEQTRSGLMGSNILGADFYYDQTMINHQTGTFSATANTVSGAGQTGSVLTVAATTGSLNQGDIITIAGVNSVNRVTKVSTGTPKQFVVLQAAPAGSTSIQIFPALVPYTITNGVAGQTQYQTVDNSPANGALIQLVNNPNELFRKNMLFVPEAFTLATADLPVWGNGVIDCARESYDGISMRMVQYYTGNSDQVVTRLDVLWGSAVLRPEWVVAIGDSI
jgi:hypothetical protein